MAELSKLDWLRVRTEEELLQLINHELDRGIRDARQVFRSAGDWAIAEELYHRAWKACDEVSRLVPLVGVITENERIAVESRLGELRGMLERVETHREPNAVCLQGC
jgi:hypothetical protein